MPHVLQPFRLHPFYAPGSPLKIQRFRHHGKLDVGTGKLKAAGKVCSGATAPPWLAGTTAISTDACSVQTAYAKVQLRRWWSFSSFQLTAASYEVWCGLDRVNPYFAVLFDGLNVLCRRDDTARLIQSTRVRTNDRCLSRQPTTLPCNEDWCQQVWIAEDPSCKRPRCLQGFSKNSLCATRSRFALRPCPQIYATDSLM